MPDLDDINIDPELFQLITLAGLALLFLLLLLALIRMTRVRRAVDRLRTDLQSYGESLHSLSTRVDGGTVGAGSAGASSGAGAAWPSAEPAEPWRSEPAVAPLQAPATRSQEPFERDGRWWAYRGDELLVYDENSGRWAPPGISPQSAPTAEPAGAGWESPASSTPEASAEGGRATLVGGAAAAMAGTEDERPARTGDTTQTPSPSFSPPDETTSTEGAETRDEDRGETAVTAEPETPGPTTGLTQETAWPQREAGAEPASAESPTTTATTGAAEEHSQEPFERDGRWWAYRGDELLVYEEGTGQWQPAADAGGGPAQPAAAAAPQPAPSTEPFERDGRWYFQRGNELLVHDEASGQWVPAGASGTTGDLSGGEGGTATFWKCPSCGAVNGSTAASCRMCFAPRP